MLVREEDANTIALNSMPDIALILLLLVWSAEDACPMAAGSSSQGMRNLPPSFLSVRRNKTATFIVGQVLPESHGLSSHNVLLVGLQHAAREAPVVDYFVC